jgi:hypothetical protein
MANALICYVPGYFSTSGGSGILLVPTTKEDLKCQLKKDFLHHQ